MNMFNIYRRINFCVFLKMWQLYFEVTLPVIVLSHSK